ncbi:DNA replication and repair protein RecF [Bdellovibrio sp. qaytius]|nr:DNA replication and repair protein RecF [Bdellovibrio sp. qaytius]
MQLNTLGLKNFRNISEAFLRLSPRLNIFIGDNGQGKTNFIESIHLLIEGESFRYSDYSTLIQFGESAAFVKATLMNNDLEYQILLKILGNKKETLVNDKKTTKIEQYLPPVVLFSPESLSVIKESADERRKLLDSLIETSVKNGKQLLQDFKKALRTRNKILKDISEEKISRDMGLQTLDSVNQIYFGLAAKLTYLRIKCLTDIKPFVQEALVKIETKNPNVSFDFSYEISDQKIVENSEEMLITLMKKRAQELLPAELSAGISLVGPQKHDVIFLYSGNDSRFYSSQGQQRSIILAFKMAQIVYHFKVNGFYPVLLLDDVLSELDQTKQSSLVLALNEIQTQTFLTSTDIEVLKKLNIDSSTVFNVQNGFVHNEKN